jgi:two-component system cell cycle sensor histidine kinase/response regulator CckA
MSVILVAASGVVAASAVYVLYQSRRNRRTSASLRFFHEMAEASGEGMFEFDVLSRQTTWTHSIGQDPIGYVGPNRLQIGTEYERVHPDDREALRNGWDGLASGEKMELMVRLREPGEAWCWCHLTVVPAADRRGRYTRAVGFLRNTNDLHQTQESLAEARRLKSVGTIAGGIAHEFNNHLTPVRGYLELALDELGLDHPCAEGLQTALERVVHCSELVSQIQAYGRKSLLVLRPTSITTYIPELVRLGAGAGFTGANQVTVRESYADHTPDVMLDRAQFQQGVRHLIRNALEAMPSGGTLSVDVGVVDIDEVDCIGQRDAAPGCYVCVQVADSGIGIPQQHLDQVLDPFFTTHGRARARGMGLPMVQGMMAQHGGWMAITSEEGRGTSIRLYFPVAKSGREPASVVEPDTTRTWTQASPAVGRLLIGDDEGFIRDIVRTVFETRSWGVDEAGSFHEVASRIEHCKESPYALLILDMTMRGPTVEEIVERLAVLHPRTKVLITSGVTRAARIDQLEARPGVTFIPKPFSTKDLVRKVDELLTQEEPTAVQ